MRKLILFTILLAAGPWLFTCMAADFFHFDFYADYSAAQQTGSIRLTTPFAELRSANRPEKFNLGFLFSSASLYKKLPVEIKAGNLSASGSLSRLNSPELSNGTSPFSNGIISVSGISASLPSYSTFSKPAGVFFQIKMNQLVKHPCLLSVNLLTSPEFSSPIFSTLISDKYLSNRLTLSASWTCGQFLYEDNYSTSFFLESPAYGEGSHLCSLAQFSAEYKTKKRMQTFYAGFTSAIYESPFGPYTAAWRLDLKASIKYTEVFASAFLNQYEELLTSSEKKLSPSTQFKAGFVSKMPLLTKHQNLIFLKFGINAFSKINLTQTEHPLRLNIGAQLTSDITSLSLTLSGTATLLSPAADQLPQSLEAAAFSAQLKNTWYFKYITPSLTLSAEKKFSTRSDSPDTMKYKFLLNLSNNNKHKLSGSCAFSFTSADRIISDKKLSAALNCKMNFKMLTVTGKISLETSF